MTVVLIGKRSICGITYISLENSYFSSNGSGKSSLAMAALWALTGSLDPRRAQDGKVSDVVNDYSKVLYF